MIWISTFSKSWRQFIWVLIPDDHEGWTRGCRETWHTSPFDLWKSNLPPLNKNPGGHPGYETCKCRGWSGHDTCGWAATAAFGCRGEPRNCETVSIAGRVGLVSCPFFLGVEFLKIPLYCAWNFQCLARQKTMSCIVRRMTRRAWKTHHQNDRSLWRVWGYSAFTSDTGRGSIPSHTEGIMKVAASTCQVYWKPGDW